MVQRPGDRCRRHRQADLVRSLGADHVIDYTTEDFADGTHRYDLILDRLRANLERTYALEEAADAIRHLEAGRVRGKVAIAV